MLFADLQKSLVDVLRTRIRNGELTERGLARLIGASQPHIHNVLKGARICSPELSDYVLQHLHISLLDLIDRERLKKYLLLSPPEGLVHVPLLRGNLGPNCPWPTEMTRDRLPFLESEVSFIPLPVAAHLGEDPKMALTFSAGDVAVLDQSRRARTDIEDGAHYLVKQGGAGIIRRIRRLETALYHAGADGDDLPSDWQALNVGRRHLTHVIRARVHFVQPLYEWV